MKTLLSQFLAIALLSFVLCTSAQSAQSSKEMEKGSAILILDASGSMWGQINGKTKIEIAREVIGDLMQNWDTSMPLGLSAYGHRRKGDCDDIETLIPVGQADPKSIIKAIHDITPKGKTPLSEAVKRAAKELRYSEERATVVLISDGVETCNMDPCAVGEELAMSGVDFTAHVIGFDVKDIDQAGLRCLAEKTGGLFLAAADADGLREALSKTVEKTKEAPAPLVEEPGEATVSCPPEVPAGSAFKVNWEGPDSRNDYISIAASNAPEGSHLSYTYTSRGNPATIYAPEKVGDYEVRYVFGHKRKTLASASINVTPVEASLTCPNEVSAGSEFEVSWTGPDNRGDYICLAPAGAEDKEHTHYTYTNRGTPAKLRAPDGAGNYEVRYLMGQSRTVLARTEITVTGVGASVKTQETVSAGAKFKVDWSGPDTQGDYISLAEKGAEDTKHITYTYTNRGNPATLRAPDQAGDYDIRYLQGQSRTVLSRTQITVTPVSASLKTPESVPAGSKFKVDWSGPDTKGDYISLAEKGAKDTKHITYTYTYRGNPAILRAPDKTAEYEIRYIMGQSRTVLARTSITLTPVSANVAAPSSVTAGTKFNVTWEGPNYQSDYISIAPVGSKDKDHKGYTYTSRGNPVELKAPAQPGAYEVRYILSQSRTALARTPVTVTP